MTNRRKFDRIPEEKMNFQKPLPERIVEGFVKQVTLSRQCGVCVEDPTGSSVEFGIYFLKCSQQNGHKIREADG